MIEITFGILVFVSIYMILEHDLRRKIFGLALLSTTVNLVLLLSGRLQHFIPAFVGHVASAELSNPLSQALVLTAIVIGFGLLVFLCVLLKVINKT